MRVNKKRKEKDGVGCLEYQGLALGLVVGLMLWVGVEVDVGVIVGVTMVVLKLVSVTVPFCQVPRQEISGVEAPAVKYVTLTVKMGFGTTGYCSVRFHPPLWYV